MKNIILCFFLTVSCLVLKAQVGSIFPEISGKTLTDKEITLPAHTKGKITLVGIAYSKKSDDLLKAWHTPIYNTFINPTQSSFVPTEQYDINMYFVGLLRGLADLVGEKIVKEIKSKTDVKLHPNVLIYEGNIKEYKEKLSLDSKELPYFFVLDKSGKILYSTSGAYSDKKLDEIIELVEAATE
jgi:hypothetical protein